MLCKNCGRELPISGKFCPFCGATVEQAGADDETAVFTTLPDDLNAPIDLSAFDAAMQDGHHAAGPADGVTTGDPLAATDPRIPPAGQMPPIDSPRVQRSTGTPESPRTTYFGTPDPDDRPYKKPSRGKKAGVIALVVVLVAALIGGGIWFFMSRRPDENQTLIEQYMKRGDFENALEACYAAQADAKDPAVFEATIHLLEDFLTAKEYVENEQYTEAIASLKQLQNRVTDTASPLYKAIEDLLTRAQAAQSDSEFAADFAEAQNYLADKKFDACAGKLDSLAADDTLTGDQKKQVEELRKKLEEAQAAAQQEEKDNQQKSERRQEFSSKIDALEQSDLQISSAGTAEDELALTAGSFEQWDSLLMDMYDYLSTILNADQYAAEESSFDQWVKERDAGAANAAKESSDETAAQLASYSFKQSYTKARCYKLLEMM